MLPEGEDLLQQLSGELGIPEFLDDLPMLEEAELPDTNSFYDTLMSDTGSVFETPQDADFTINFNAFPPSPSNSDTSSSNSTTSTLDIKDGILSPIGFHSEISPPVSPPAISMSNLASNGASIVSVSDLSNVKIPIPKIQKPKPPPASPLILTSQQLAQLTQAGVLQLNNATTYNNGLNTPAMPSTTTTAPLVIKSEPNPLSMGATPTIQSLPHNVSQDDIKHLKRQQRMIKNRESACMSRKKKKEYVTNIEDQLNGLIKDNRVLKQDNEVLRQRVRELEAEKNQFWTSSGVSKVMGPNGRKATALLALLCVVSLNIGTLSNVYHQPTEPRVDINAKIKRDLSSMSVVPQEWHGRSLLWKTQSEADQDDDDGSDSSSNDTTTGFNYDPKCSMQHFNHSESIRLDTLLRGLFQSDESVKAKNATVSENAPTSPVKKAAKPYETSLGPYGKPQASRLSGTGFYQILIPPSTQATADMSRTGMTLYDEETPRFTYASFFEAIHRREDTFYVVSFSGDHLLLPASARNESSRPRMSLLLPSVPLNDSMKPPEGHVAMMQIDCEVMNTRLLHIRQDSIPDHVSHAMRADASNASLQRNDSHEDHRHRVHPQFDRHSGNTTGSSTKARGGYPRFGSLRYAKDNDRYSKPSVIQQHDFPRLPSAAPAASSSSSIPQHPQTHYHQSKKQWKRTHARASHSP